MSNFDVVVLGNEDFLPVSLQNRSAFKVEFVKNLTQAKNFIDKASPSVLVVQVSYDPDTELCQWIKHQPQQHLRCIYIIMLEDRSQRLTQRSREWEMMMASMVLYKGAAAYICLGNVCNYSQAEENLLLTHLSVGMSMTQYCRQLLELALTDPLTKLRNARAWDSERLKQIKEARDFNTSLSIILLEIDEFKRVNVEHGEHNGNRVLKTLSKLLQQNIRDFVLFRYQIGDEFGLILQKTTCKEALDLAHHLNQIVRKQPIALENTLEVNITISLGVTCLQPDDDAQGDSMVKRAREYVAQAKKDGRDRVMGCDGCTSRHNALPLSFVYA
ncbi:MAG: GGDEF domain-containing protein [Scytonema sp. PMC 1069.18]|nr:GGDEF domain-containing protein [Scytonema sp. PMC 1069.18]MEC4887103.1 GGDEF domain-containing protein [Scytonema sp. PMC 1070.18]